MREGPTPKKQQDVRVIGVATGLGCSIVAALMLCIGGGVLLDRYFGTEPVLTLLGVVLGLIVAGYQLWELAKIGNPKARPGAVSQRLARMSASRSRGGSARAPVRENEGDEE
jgi:F0F1-type ATP synthase assembly protein I